VAGEYRIIPVAANWKVPLFIALSFHVAVLGSAIYVPRFLPKKTITPEFLTVDLINVTAPLPQAAPPPEPVQAKIKTQKLKPVLPVKKSSPVAPIADTVETPEPVKAISIKPLKRKKKKKIVDSRIARDKKKARDRRALEMQRQQLLAEAQRKKALAEAEEAAASEAVQALKEMLLADAAAADTAVPSSPRQGGSSGSLVEDQYRATIGSRFMASWSLPTSKLLNPDLQANVIINISKDGRITSHRFEKRSGDRVFDQFVSRAIQEANPLPPIPKALRMSQYSIGLRFRPGSIQ